MSNSILIAGPWVGEFGWELMEWQAHIRALSKQYDRTICIGPKSSEYFYSDFCSDYLVYKNKDIIGDCWFGRYRNSFSKILKPNKNLVNNILQKNRMVIDDYDLFCPRLMISPKERGKKKALFAHYKDSYLFKDLNYKQNFIRFGKKGKKYDLIIHARNRTHVRPDDNWSADNWRLLVNSLSKKMKIASIGKASDALHIKGTDNLLNLNMKDLCNIMCSSKWMIGPESGPTHLAALCKLNYIVWSPKQRNKSRCLEDWNPFKTNGVFILDKNPNIEKIKRIIIGKLGV